MSISTMKKILLAGTALVAAAAFGTQAYAATVTINGADQAIAADPAATPAITFTTDNVATINSGITLSTAGDTVTAGTANFGTLTFAGGTQAVNGAIGTGNAIKLINAGVTGGAVTLQSTVNAQTITLSGGTGTLTATGAVTATTLNINGTGSVTLNAAASNPITTTNFGADGTLNIGTGGTLTGLVSTSTVDTGTLTLAGAGTVTGTVGATNEIKALNAGVQATTSTFNSAVSAKTVTIDGGASAAATGAATFSGALNVGTGGMTVSSHGTGAAQVETATVTGNFTDTGALNITAAATAGANANLILNGATNSITGATTLTDGGASATLTVSGNAVQTVTGAINAAGASQGTLVSNNAAHLVTFNSAIGGSAAATGLKTVTLTGIGDGTNATTFASTVRATTININNATGLDTFTGAVTGNIAYGAAGTALLSAGQTGNVDFVNHNGVLQIADGKTVTGTIDDSTGVNGTLTLLGSSTLAGTVGATNSLTLINAGANGATDTFSAATKATTTHVTGTGTVNFNAATTTNLVFDVATGNAVIGAAGSLTGSADGAANSDGNLTINGASAGVTTIGTAHNLKALTLGANVTTSGAVNAADTTTLAGNTLTTGGAFNILAGQTLAATATGTGTTGHINANGQVANVAATSVIKLTNVTAAGNYDVISGAAGGTITAAAAGDLFVNGVANTAVGTTAFNVGRMTYQEVVDATKLRITATQNAITSALGAAITSNDVSAATALNTIGLGHGAALDTFQGNLNGAASAGALHTLLQSVTPTVDGGAQQAALAVGADVQNVGDIRMAALRDGDTKSGVAAGATANGVSMWVQGYGQHAHQDAKDSVDGYSSNTWGGVVGTDTTTLLDKAIIGIAFNYGHSKVDSDNANTTTTDVGNYGVNLYGNYDLGDRMFVNGQLGFAYNTIDSDRHNVGGVAGQTASGKTNSDEYLARADLGRDYPMEGGLTLTPDVNAAYTYLHTAGYTESGAGALDQVVGSNNDNVLGLGIGGTAAWKIKDADDNVFTPALHAGYTFDAGKDKVSTTSAFAGDPGVSFTTTGAAPSRNVFDVGAKLLYATRANWDVSATYDFQIKQSYTSHTGEVRATAHF